MTPYDQVKKRSDNRCEALVKVRQRGKRLYARCFRQGVEVHHMLTRARGGLILDEYGETRHLIALCPRHHTWAHGPDGYEAGLMIDGYVTTGADGVPVYQGGDPRLSHLRSLDVPDVPGDLPGAEPGPTLRGEA